MKILSVHSHSHDSTVTYIEGNDVKYILSSERLSRIKNDDGFPALAFKKLLFDCKINPSDIDKLVVVGRPFLREFYDFVYSRSLPFRKTKGKCLIKHKKPHIIFYNTLLSTGIPSFVFFSLIPKMKLLSKFHYMKKIEYVPHHFSHIASAYYCSGWNECITGCIEGEGFPETLSFFHVKDGKFELLTKTEMPHSVGRFYELVTAILGFHLLRHPGKITGLAAYGNPVPFYEKVKRLLWVEGTQIYFDYRFAFMVREILQEKNLMATFYSHKNYKPARNDPWKELPYFCDYKREDIAASFQKRLEDCLCEVVQKLARKTGLRKIALAGGVVANVRLNQQIHAISEIDEIYIHPGMGDMGLSLGAGLHVAAKNGHKPKRLENLYLGPEYSEKEILKELKSYDLKFTYEDNIERKGAELLSEGKIVARFHGRMEYGPRALGNRSILFQTTDKTVNNWLNKKLKRTEFMPFAPVTLSEFSEKCYKNIKGAEFTAKFMTITFECTDYMKKVSPSVVHVDGTARPQFLSREDNPSFYRILENYYKITGIPSLINTSFNMHEEPIVCSPDDAIRSFIESGIDYLAIEKFLIKKNR